VSIRRTGGKAAAATKCVGAVYGVSPDWTVKFLLGRKTAVFVKILTEIEQSSSTV
jgi:hypothetical protein